MQILYMVLMNSVMTNILFFWQFLIVNIYVIMGWIAFS